MLKKIIFTAFVAGLVFGAQELAIKTKASSNSDANFEQTTNESQLRVEKCIQKDSSTVGMIECIKRCRHIGIDLCRDSIRCGV